MANLNVLIVEDNLIVRDMIAEMVDSLGYIAISATTGEAARDRLADEDVDILLIDIDLGPGLSGTDLVTSGYADMPQVVVLMSGAEKPASLPAGIRYLSKPFTLTQLEAALEP